VFDAEDIARERGVILEEIKMDEDNPDYLVTRSSLRMSGKTPLGKPILWHQRDGQAFERQAVLDAYAPRFAPGNIVVSAAGNLDHDTS